MKNLADVPLWKWCRLSSANETVGHTFATYMMRVPGGVLVRTSEPGARGRGPGYEAQAINYDTSIVFVPSTVRLPDVEAA